MSIFIKDSLGFCTINSSNNELNNWNVLRKLKLISIYISVVCVIQKQYDNFIIYIEIDKFT